MIKVNRKMTWEEVTDTYGGLIILISEVIESESELGILPTEAYVHFVIETEEDMLVADDKMRENSNYTVCKPDVSKKRAKEHPELAYVEVV